MITQEHREYAASKIKGDDKKAVYVRRKIIAGECDYHPVVQAAEFYGVPKPKGETE